MHEFCDKATRVGRGMMTKTFFCSRHSLLRIALVLLFSTTAFSASAQIIEGLLAKPKISVFGTLTADVQPDFSYYGDPAVYGYSAGGFWQTGHIVGVEVRGSILRLGGLEHEESALAGPRFAMHFGHISPYVSVLGGAGNGWRWSTPPVSGGPRPRIVEGLGPQWSVLGGLDVQLSQHIVFRTGELSYSKIYLKDWNLTPLNVTTGIVFRLK